MVEENSIIFQYAESMCAPVKLEREKGETRFEQTPISESDALLLCKWIVTKIDSYTSWEEVYGGLTVAKILCNKLPTELLLKVGLSEELKSRVLECHESSEFRVRIAAADLMGCLCKKFGLDIFHAFLPAIKQGISESLERDFSENDDASVTSLNGSRLSLFHDTAGWKHLETWMKCLQNLISGLGAEKLKDIHDSELLELIFTAVKHTNRFVRETGYDLLGILIQNYGCYQSNGDQEDSVKSTFLIIAKQLSEGLCDDWSQVRMTASKTVRLMFSVSFPPGVEFSDVYSILLPPMALNRHYVAEGVRLYSQETWKLATGGCGKKMLESCLRETLDFYILQTNADDHAVREAACAAIAEAGCKLNPDLLRPHLARLLETLVVCFDDDNWPVRDAACIAIGNLVSAFPVEARMITFPSSKPSPDSDNSDCSSVYSNWMADRFLLNLVDNIASVRIGAAQAIGKVVKAMLQEDNAPGTHDDILVANKALIERYIAFIETNLKGLADQTPEPNVASAGSTVCEGHVVVDAHDARHTNQPMYCCGSMAPEPKKKRKHGHCHEGPVQRPALPWERADGVVHLMTELAEHASAAFPDHLVPLLVDAASRTHYSQHVYFLETASALVHVTAVHLDKARFKRHLDALLPVLGWAFNCSLPLAVCAAEEAFTTIAKKVGPNILRGRIQNHQDASCLDKLLTLLPQY